MGIPIGWNIVRDEAHDKDKDKDKDKDVLRADVTGARSVIRRRSRGSRALRRMTGAFDAPDGFPTRFASVLDHAPLSHARTQLPQLPQLLPLPELRDHMRDLHDDHTLPTLTPGFAPAAPRSPSPSPYANDQHTTTTTTTITTADDPPSRAVPPRGVPPQNPTGRRIELDGLVDVFDRRQHDINPDGLGDRDRSNSVSSTASGLPWQPFLTTVVPDPVPPTAESSFASSAASASFAVSSSRASSSNSNSAASEHTHVTIPSRRGDELSETFARACESSDEGESTSSDTDDDDAAAANPLSRRRLRPSHFADAPPSPRRYGRSVTDQGIDARRYVRSYYSDAAPHSLSWDLDRLRNAQMDGPVDESTANREHEPEGDSFTTVADDDDDDVAAAQRTVPASPLDQELRDVRSVIERLARRGDISDDFWASVGLTRRLADGVQRVQDRGRF